MARIVWSIPAIVQWKGCRVSHERGPDAYTVEAKRELYLRGLTEFLSGIVMIPPLSAHVAHTVQTRAGT